MGRRKKKTPLTGPVDSDATGPGGDGGIPASAPSSSYDGCEGGGMGSAATMETESQTSDVERPAAMLPGLDWEKDLAPWWDEAGAKTPTAELFHRAMGGYETVKEETDGLVEAIETFLWAKKPDLAIERVQLFAEKVRYWMQEHAWVISELTRRECVRYGEEIGRSAKEVPDSGKGFRDQGTETEDAAPDCGAEFRDQGTETEEVIGVPTLVAPLPGELEARLEDISSRLETNSDRLGLLERRLKEVEDDRAGVAREAPGVKRKTGMENVGEWVRVSKGEKGKRGKIKGRWLLGIVAA